MSVRAWTVLSLGLATFLAGCGVQSAREASRRSGSGDAAKETAAPAAGGITVQNPLFDSPVVESESPTADPRGEGYAQIEENPFQSAAREPLSTFSIDVDTASYANVRRFLMQHGQLPPPAAVRIEELVNYFRYDDPQPEADAPFSVTVEVAGCPWNHQHRLARIGLKGRDVDAGQRPPGNFVFLVDCSGSMDQPNKLPLVKQVLGMLVDGLDAADRIAVVGYAGAAGLVLPSTSAEEQEAIHSSLNNLRAGGSTHGSAGITLAYDIAAQNFIEGGVNRVILCTDGDFNVGIADRNALAPFIEEQAKTGVFLSVLGFGMGNYQDATAETLADKGNGNYSYIDTVAEARKVLWEEMAGTLVTIAKDVKIQVDFNPTKVAGYRLLGYENRMLRAEDFKDDKKDAGEIGAGHSVTALYEIVPAGTSLPGEVEPSKYQASAEPRQAEVDDPVQAGSPSDELLTVRLRYKQPDGDTSTPLYVPAADDGQPYADASADFRFAAAVAEFGLLLRNSRYKEQASFDSVLELARDAVGADPSGHRGEFLELVHRAKSIRR